MLPSATPCLSPADISACVSSSPSRYLVARSSSASATASISRSRASSTSSDIESGASPPGSSKLTTPEKLDSAPMGSATAMHCRPNRSVIDDRARAKSALSRSILLTKMMRGSSRSSASFHICCVPTSTPEGPSTTTTAASATLTAEVTSPLKSAYPGVSRRLILWDRQGYGSMAVWLLL